MNNTAVETPGLRIVADENIPALERFFGDLGTLRRCPGRTLSREQLSGADILLVRSVTEVNQSLLQGTPVRFVGSCTIGTDHLDIPWLERNGIHWSAAPGCNANAVVEYVFCALAALEVDWRGRSFGIVGCGNVGGLLQKRLHALGASCAVYDPWLPDNPDSAPLAQVLGRDIVCLHAPLVKGGRYPSLHMIGPEQLSHIRDGAVLISAGRGAVLDSRALLQRLKRKPCFRTVLDVWENEPEIDTELLQRVDLATPHIAGYSDDGKLAGTRQVREGLSALMDLALPPMAPETSGNSATIRIVPGNARSGEADLGAGQGGAMADLLLQMYDPRVDDRRLREAASDTEPMAQGFDRLRREYPKRLEFCHYTAPAEVLNEEELQQLAVLGLMCK
ncbi:4-phosphoerythronate dehydrogenase [Microbulbifer spongiae]|uniref:Erythronate-4-phosphate dehydrogenase n=1 Tax=Microbulbifer spongiae TaxID=2944933 RepID=A0ABY9EHF3_9GAMM|nr:4-phosphoerythronate dehydrogenase [Microbulbifer sp. MI-G]WKD50930.1 4-phosphoerythronate dehydrogenase [Microbulbifer sp. MI-G]